MEETEVGAAGEEKGDEVDESTAALKRIIIPGYSSMQ